MIPQIEMNSSKSNNFIFLQLSKEAKEPKSNLVDLIEDIKTNELELLSILQSNLTQDLLEISEETKSA